MANLKECQCGSCSDLKHVIKLTEFFHPLASPLKKLRSDRYFESATLTVMVHDVSRIALLEGVVEL